jgi:hypothetical protein
MTTIYVSMIGNDATGDGSQLTPYRSWQKGHDVAVPGDEILIAPGTYTPLTVVFGVRLSRPGPITMRGNNGIPVLDCSSVNNGWNAGIDLRASNWTLQDLRITGLAQRANSDNCAGVYVNGTDAGFITGNVLRHLETDHNDGIGILVDAAAANTLLEDCDSHHNYDPLTTAGAGTNADGFHLSPSSTGTICRTCRAWQNSDDGFDVFDGTAAVTFDQCWSVHNGRVPDTEIIAGDGGGFNFGNGIGLAHRATQCLSISNLYGMNKNSNSGAMILYNNNVYNSYYANYRFREVGGTGASILRNNIGYHELNDISYFHVNVIHDHNSWDTVPVTNGDFVSLDFSGLTAPREFGGDLPSTQFMKLASSSDLINAGINVGLPYIGPAPDIGAFESPVTSSNPVLLSELARRAVLAPSTDQVFLDLLTITHPALSSPIRLVNNTSNVNSRGHTFFASAFKFTPPSQVAEGEPNATVEIQNINRVIEEVLAGLTTEPTFTGEIVLATAPDVVQFGPWDLPLASAELTGTSIRLSLGYSNPLLMRNFPNARYNSKWFPGLSAL